MLIWKMLIFKMLIFKMLIWKPFVATAFGAATEGVGNENSFECQKHAWLWGYESCKSEAEKARGVSCPWRNVL